MPRKFGFHKRRAHFSSLVMTGQMGRDEALQILGLKPGATEAEIREAHHRLMRRAHPDVGGSEWIASRINQARDVLLG